MSRPELPAVRVGRLAITDFRNLERQQFVLPEQGIALVGWNGQGKTNLLEAVYYLHLLRSFRGARDADVTRFNAPGFHIGASVSGAPRGVSEVSVGFDRHARRKRVLVNGSQPARLSDAYGAVPAVMCSPDDRELVSGVAASRRRFLDVMLATVLPRYLTALQQYRTALAQRNAALREIGRGTADETTLEVWEPALAEHGATIVAARAQWAAERAADFTALGERIGERAVAEMRHSTNVASGESRDSGELRSALAERLSASRRHDIRRGVTHAGPHRDDLRLTIAGREMREFASAGQQRTAALALRMLEVSTLRRALGSQPVLLLDDPFAELDRERAARILEMLRESEIGQLILCVPREDDVPPELSELPQWRIESGQIRE